MEQPRYRGIIIERKDIKKHAEDAKNMTPLVNFYRNENTDPDIRFGMDYGRDITNAEINEMINEI